MKGLLIKDFRVLAKQKKFLILVLLLSVFLAFGSDDVGFAGNYVMLILSTLTLTTISYDEMNGGMLFLLSLPATRKTYVKEKYMFAFLDILTAAVIAMVLGYAECVVKKVAFSFGDTASGIMGMMLVVGLMLAVAIPLDFKFGAEKGRMIVTGAMIGVAFVGIAGFKFLTEVLHIDLVGGLTKFLSGIESEAVVNCILLGGLLVLTVLVLFCSYLISKRIMTKKEF